jgi:SAM-dependent methyltransferase
MPDIMQTPERILAILADAGARTVADIGCGSGALSRVLAAHGHTVTGIDPDADAVSRARESVPDARFEQATAEALPFADASLDAAVFLNALHHVPVPLMRQALAEVRRVLRPGGTLIVVEPLAEGSFFEVMRPVEDETAIRREALVALRADMAAGNWTERAEQSYDRFTDFASVDGFIDYLVAVDPARRAIAEALRKELDALLKERATPAENGFRLTQPMLLVAVSPER